MELFFIAIHVIVHVLLETVFVKLIRLLKQFAISKGIAYEQLYDYLGFADSYFNAAIGAIPSNFYEEISEDVDGWWEFRQHLSEIREELGFRSGFTSSEVIDEVSLILTNTGFKDRMDKIRQSKEGNDEASS